MEQEPIVYTEEGFNGMGEVFLPDDEYARAIEAFIVPCVDILIVDPNHTKAYLAYRIAKPLQNAWWFIGGRRVAGVVPREAAQRVFKRETSLEVDAARFVFITVIEYLFKDRAQTPQNKAVHTQGYTYALALTDEERAVVAANLDTKEYNASQGLKAFTLQEIKDGSHHPVVVEIASRTLH
jgi:ADP-ribose pyrophosphatase YjhB (NUDIX family)